MKYVSSAAILFAIAQACVVNGAFDTNLIKNPGAESGVGSSDGSVVAVPSWTTTSNFTVVKYGSPGGFPAVTDPGPLDRGLNFFAGGSLNPGSSASQLIDATADAIPIDAGIVTYDLSGYLGGFFEQGDNAFLSATFLSGSNLALATASIGPVTPAERLDLTGLHLRNTSGAVPVGTRKINIQLQMTRLDFNYNDGYADSLSLVFHAVPEPTTAILLLTAGAVGGTVRRGRTKVTKSIKFAERSPY